MQQYNAVQYYANCLQHSPFLTIQFLCMSIQNISTVSDPDPDLAFLKKKFQHKFSKFSFKCSYSSLIKY
jgi:hypothetical protein